MEKLCRCFSLPAADSEVETPKLLSYAPIPDEEYAVCDEAVKLRTQSPSEYFLYALKYGFTTYNGLSLTALVFANVPHARAVASCTTVGIAASFSAAFFLEPTSFPRIAQRLGISLPAFHFANFVVHLLPCALVLVWSTAPITLVHALVAALIHLGWGAWRSACTMALDDIYVPLPRETWLNLWAIAVVAELFVMPAVDRSGSSLWTSAPLASASAVLEAAWWSWAAVLPATRQ